MLNIVNSWVWNACRSVSFSFKIYRRSPFLIFKSWIKGEREFSLHSQVWKAYMHSLVSMHITYRSHTHTITNCTYACARQTRASVHVPVNTAMRRTVLYDPRRGGSGTRMLELFTLNLRDDVREANARGKMQNTECKTWTADSTRERERERTR